MIWFTADSHLDHANVMRYCNRPFENIEEMNRILVSNWNMRVGKKDEVYIVGDFAWKRHMHFLMQLNGKKHLVIGNHDKMSQDEYKNFSSCAIRMQKVFDKQLVILDHFPMRSWNGRCHKSWHLFGHVHGRFGTNLIHNTMDVGVDCNDYCPVSWYQVVDFMKKQVPFPDGQLDEQKGNEHGRRSERDEAVQEHVALDVPHGGVKVQLGTDTGLCQEVPAVVS